MGIPSIVVRHGKTGEEHANAVGAPVLYIFQS